MSATRELLSLCKSTVKPKSSSIVSAVTNINYKTTHRSRIGKISIYFILLLLLVSIQKSNLYPMNVVQADAPDILTDENESDGDLLKKTR